MPIPFKLRPVAALLSIALMAAGCGGGDNAGNSTAVLAQQSFKIADMPETSTSQAGSQQAANPLIDQAVQAALKQFKLPGATVVVLKDGQLIYVKGYGYSNLAARTPARPEDRFQIGSISKMFVATAIMLLVEDGKLGLDDKVGKYFPGLPDSWSPITVRMLLSHSSGVPSDASASSAHTSIDKNFDRFMAGSDAERVAAIAAIPLSSAPGTKFEYSNLAYTVLGMLATKVAGMDHVELLQQRVFRPLGMTSARKIDAANPMAGTASGYRQEGDSVREITLGPSASRFAALGAGGLEMNALDLAKWDNALHGNQVLKASSLAEMTKGQIDAGDGAAYGFGWYLFTVNGHVLQKHSGSMAGFVSDYRRWPNDRFSTIVLTNNGDVTLAIPGALHIARAVTDVLQPALSIR
jgi:CubicO group peptidase (beta-lactamase class C family)